MLEILPIDKVKEYFANKKVLHTRDSDCESSRLMTEVGSSINNEY